MRTFYFEYIHQNAMPVETLPGDVNIVYLNVHCMLALYAESVSKAWSHERYSSNMRWSRVIVKSVVEMHTSYLHIYPIVLIHMCRQTWYDTIRYDMYCMFSYLLDSSSLGRKCKYTQDMKFDCVCFWSRRPCAVSVLYPYVLRYAVVATTSRFYNRKCFAWHDNFL